MVGAAPTLDIPLRSDIVFLVERRRGLLRKAHTATTEKWCLHSVVDLQAAINRFSKEHNEQPKPFIWKADPDNIIAAVRRGHQVLESTH